MSLLENLGDSVIKALQTILYYLLGIMIKLAKVGREIVDRIEKIEREKIYPIFEKKNIEVKDYVILKLQISSMVFLLFAVLYIFNTLGKGKFIILGLISGLSSVYLIFITMKEHFDQDYNAYRDFFLSYLAMAMVLIIIKRIKPSVNFLFPYFHLVLASVIGVVAIDVLFKKKYGRDYTIGRVLVAGSMATVKFNYDICASIKPGILLLENSIKAGEGDTVKLKVEKGFLNLKGSRVTEIVGVVNE